MEFCVNLLGVEEKLDIFCSYDGVDGRRIELCRKMSVEIGKEMRIWQF
jgi:hypothetical protein